MAFGDLGATLISVPRFPRSKAMAMAMAVAVERHIL